MRNFNQLRDDYISVMRHAAAGSARLATQRDKSPHHWAESILRSDPDLTHDFTDIHNDLSVKLRSCARLAIPAIYAKRVVAHCH